MHPIRSGIRHEFTISLTFYSQKTTGGQDPPTEAGGLSFCLHYPAAHDAQQDGFGKSRLTVGMPPGIAPQPDSVGAFRNRFQITDNLHFFHKQGLEEVDEAYDEFESTP